MSKDAKLIRGQVRQVVQEILTEELVKAVEARVTKLVNERLDKLDKRQKDILGFTIRNTELGRVK